MKKRTKTTPSLFVKVIGTGRDGIYSTVLKNSNIESAKQKGRELWSICSSPVRITIKDENSEILFSKKV